MNDEWIAVVEQQGRQIVARLADHPHLQGAGRTQEEALQALAETVRIHQRRQRSKAPLVTDVIVRTHQR